MGTARGIPDGICKSIEKMKERRREREIKHTKKRKSICIKKTLLHVSYDLYFLNLTKTFKKNFDIFLIFISSINFTVVI